MLRAVQIWQTAGSMYQNLIIVSLQIRIKYLASCMQANPLPMHAVMTLSQYLAIGSSHQVDLTHPGSHSNDASCPGSAQTSHQGGGATQNLP